MADVRPAEARYLVPMLGHALRVIEALATGGEAGLSLQEVVGRAGVSKSSAFRILFTLTHDGWVERDATGRYRLGPRPFALVSSDVVAQRKRARVRQEMEALRDRFGETVNLATLDERGVGYVEILDGTHALRLSAAVGDRAPLHAAAVAKAILVSLPKERRTQVLAGATLARLTDKSLTSRAALDRELVATDRRGWAVDDGETEPGALCVAVALPEPAVGAPAAMSLSGPAERMRARQSEIVEALITARDRLAGHG